MAMFLPVPEIFTAATPRAPEPGAETSAVCAQAAHVRSLLDELDLLAPPSTRPHAEPQNLAAHAVEELTHLAFRMMEAAAAIAPHRVVELCLRRAPLAAEPAPADR